MNDLCWQLVVLAPIVPHGVHGGCEAQARQKGKGVPGETVRLLLPGSATIDAEDTRHKDERDGGGGACEGEPSAQG